MRGLLKYSRALAPGAEAPPLCAMDPAQVAFFVPRLADARAAALAALDSAAPGAGCASAESAHCSLRTFMEGVRDTAADLMRLRGHGV